MKNDISGEDRLDRVIESVKPPGDREYIENNLTRFLHILRHLGVRISSAEAVDAVNALAAVNMLDRRQVETAFLATLAKSAEDRVILDRAFQAYFVTPEEKAERTAKQRQNREQEAREIQAVQDELKY